MLTNKNLSKFTKLFKTFIFMKDLKPFIRWHFLYAAYETGLSKILQTPLTKEEIIDKLRIKQPEFIDPLLDLGVALGELSCKKGRYKAKGKSLRLFMSKDGDMYAAIIQANVTYYNSAYRSVASRLMGEKVDDIHLDEIGGIVARVGQMLEPFEHRFIKKLFKGKGPLKAMDVGCGSGIHMKMTLELNPEVSTIGIDMDANVVEQANNNFKLWGLSDRCRAVIDNITSLSENLAGSYDIITLYNMIYYFPNEERGNLLSTVRPMLFKNGKIALITTIQGHGKSFFPANLDLACRSIEGCYPVPELDELCEQLRDSGFKNIEKHRIVPGDTLFGIVAEKE